MAGHAAGVLEHLTLEHNMYLHDHLEDYWTESTKNSRMASQLEVPHLVSRRRSRYWEGGRQSAILRCRRAGVAIEESIQTRQLEWLCFECQRRYRHQRDRTVCLLVRTAGYAHDSTIVACTHPGRCSGGRTCGSPLLAALYFVSYVVLSSYMIMSVLIAVVMINRGRIPSSQCLPQECIR